MIEVKPQIITYERRFVHLDIHPFSEVYPVNGLTKRAQISAMPVITYVKAALSRFRTRMTRIARIFTDPCASASSAQSVFHCTTGEIYL
jgi:hypothetical protein